MVCGRAKARPGLSTMETHMTTPAVIKGHVEPTGTSGEDVMFHYHDPARGARRMPINRNAKALVTGSGAEAMLAVKPPPAEQPVEPDPDADAPEAEAATVEPAETPDEAVSQPGEPESVSNEISDDPAPRPNFQSMTREQLVDYAISNNITIDNRWGIGRLRKHLEKQTA